MNVYNVKYEIAVILCATTFAMLGPNIIITSNIIFTTKRHNYVELSLVRQNRKIP